MNRKHLISTVALFSTMVLATASVATAGEWFVDLYGGVASTEDEEIRASDFTSVPTQEIGIDTSFDSSSTIGIRNGLWVSATGGLGFAWDLSSYRAEEESVDIAIVEASALILYRWRLAKNPTRPAGRLQPYVGAGFGVVFADVDVQPQGEDGLHDGTFEDSLDLLAGLHWRPAPKNGAFIEYRFSHVELDIEPRGFLFNNLIHTIRGDVDTNRLLIGWSYRPGG
jgi:opacity protein-like surface antigen